MEAPFNFEDRVWKAIQNGRRDELLSYFKKTSVILLNEKRFDGEEFADLVLDNKPQVYTINMFEVLVSENISKKEMLTQAIYVSKVNRGKEAKPVTYSIASTWKRSEIENELLSLIIHTA